MFLHGVSHAGVSMLSVVAAGVVTEFVADQVPSLTLVLHKYIAPALLDVGFEFDTWQFLRVTVVLFMGLIWGMTFKAVNKK
jgi:hypothetical protein